MRMLFTLLLTALTATSGLAGSGSQEEGASLTFTGGNTTGEVNVVIDGYTHYSTLTSGDSVPLGTQLILVCQVVGLPYGTPLCYTWTCPNGTCEVEGYYGRKIYNQHILVVNTTSTSDGGTYTCQVTATGGQEANASFTLNVTGGSVVHSLGRLVPHKYPITSIQQIHDNLCRFERISCTVSNGTARFISPSGDVTQYGMNQTAQLIVNLNNDHYRNKDVYCNSNDTNYFYLYIRSGNIPQPGLTLQRLTSSQVVYETTAHGSATRVIAGYEVFRFGVPMVGEYVNTGRGKRVPISPAVPGARYRITAWALGNGSRSENSTVKSITTREAYPSTPRNITITRVFQDGVEVSWLPPTEPNGEVHYVIEYKTEDSGSWTSVNTTSDSTHYNLTELNSGTNYTIRVVAVNSAGRPHANIPIERIVTVKPSLNTVQPTSSTVSPTATSSNVNPTSSSNNPIASTTTPTTTTAFMPTNPGTAVEVVGVATGVAAVFFLFLIVAVPSAVTLALLRRAQRKKETSLEMWEEKLEKVEEGSTARSREQNDAEVAPGYDREECNEKDPLYDSVDIIKQSCRSKVKVVQFGGGYCDIVDASDVESQEEAGPHSSSTEKKGQQVSPPTSTPNAVYAQVDKSKKKKKRKLQSGDDTTTQSAYTEDLHYESSDVFGQYAVGADVRMDGTSTVNCPESEPCDPKVVYAVVDKSKKRNRGETNAAPSQIDAQEEGNEAQEGSSNERETSEVVAQQTDNEQYGDQQYLNSDDSAAHTQDKVEFNTAQDMELRVTASSCSNEASN